LNYTIALWRPLSERWFCRRHTQLALAFFLAFPDAAPALAPVFDVREYPVSELLSPEQLPPSFYTFEPDEYRAQPRDSYWLNFSNWILLQERTQGPRIQWLGQWADRTLSGSDQVLPDNASYLRLGFATESGYGNPASFNPEARFRLDVPTARKKLRLLIESDSEELIPLDERQRDRQLTEPERTNTLATGALRYLTLIGDAINFSTDIGIRLHFPPDAFWRATAKKQWHPDNDWTLKAQQRFYYYHSDGWGERTAFGAGRMLGHRWYFQSWSELEWIHNDGKFVAGQIFSARKRVSDRTTLTPRVGVLGESKPNWRTTSTFADLTLRHRLHSDWVYAELVPALTFTRENHFRDEISVVFRVELYFSGSIQRAY